ncbi:hypothetical protein GDO78_018484 [Eleutherodactylus coqui]|uniref:Uncharacterized protein n=1 Tax=Eleutherodactylus coqui TaxID=57060 RepID=A0A8J6E7S5_ELECQ|nr:hypothetical protein GDO78_018484 [Eleutherodactylus coqui]
MSFIRVDKHDCLWFKTYNKKEYTVFTTEPKGLFHTPIPAKHNLVSLIVPDYCPMLTMNTKLDNQQFLTDQIFYVCGGWG